MINYIFISIITWYFYNLIEYIFHRLGHSKKYGGLIYKLHMNHHKNIQETSMVDNQMHKNKYFSTLLPSKYN